MSTPNNQLQTTPKESAFSMESFDHAQRIAKMLSSSSLVPKDYQGRVDNCLIALEMANRNGASPLMVMQNLHIIQGKPSWSSPFIIASLNTCGRFKTKVKFRKSGEGDDYGYEAYATDTDGTELVGPKVTWKMVKDEGWLAKPGSKWKTMPELMFQYRSAAFFGRLHAPDILMGMQAIEEVMDVSHEVLGAKSDLEAQKESDRIFLMIQDSVTVEELEKLEEHLKDEHWEKFEARRIELTIAK